MIDFAKKTRSGIKIARVKFGNPNKLANVGNYTIEVDVREGIQKGIFYGWYETVETQWFNDILKPGMIVVDVGASFGYYSFIASSLVGDTGKVYSFEPSTRSFEKFVGNIQRNAITNIEPHSVGLGEVECNKELFDSVGCDLNTEDTHAPTFAPKTFYPVNGRSMGFIPIIRLDRFWKDNHLGNIDLVKIDVEGFERSVLRGMSGILSAGRIKWIMIEYLQPTPLFKKCTESDLMDTFLGSYGFGLFKAKQHDFGDLGYMGNFLYKHNGAWEEGTKSIGCELLEAD
jgi:FkbM family methyltransferase